MSDEIDKYAEARRKAIDEFERNYLGKILDRASGNVSIAAREAGIDRVYLHRLLRKHKIRSRAPREDSVEAKPAVASEPASNGASNGTPVAVHDTY